MLLAIQDFRNYGSLNNSSDSLVLFRWSTTLRVPSILLVGTFSVFLPLILRGRDISMTSNPRTSSYSRSKEAHTCCDFRISLAQG